MWKVSPTATAEAPPASALLDSKQVAELLAIPVSSVQALSRAGKLPTVHIGRTNRYRRETVAAWIEEIER